MRWAWSVSLSVTLLAVSACGGKGSGDGSEAGDTEGEGEASGESTEDLTEDATSDDGAAEGITFRFQLYDFATNGDVTGAEICVADAPEIECAVSGADGTAALAVPENVELLVEITHELFRPTHLPLVSGEDGTFTVQLLRHTDGANFYAALGLEEDEGRGAIGATAGLEGEGGLAGAVGILDPVSGDGPFYFADGFPSTEATATADDGIAVWVNVEPGEYEVEMSHELGPCEYAIGWPGSTPMRQRLPVAAGWTVIVSAECEPP